MSFIAGTRQVLRAAALLVCCLIFALVQERALAQSAGASCADGVLASGALYRLCVDFDRWNRDVVVVLPGYEDPANPPSLLSGDSGFVRLLTRLGYAFATTSFRATGLIDPDTWIGEDLNELVAVTTAVLAAETGETVRRRLLLGGSQGGLGTVKAMEELAQLFSGGLAACAPIGSYRRQFEHIFGFRAVFDYFLADGIDGWPRWRQDLDAGDPGFVDPGYEDTAREALARAFADPGKARLLEQVLNVTGAATDPADPASVFATTTTLLGYSFRGTNNAIERLDGLPFANFATHYRGSLNDAALNEGIERFWFTADIVKLGRLETTGDIRRPLVTMHTTGDPVVPLWQQSLYRDKLGFFGRLLHTPITIDRYGHCEFTESELLSAFALLVLKVIGHGAL